MQKNLITCVFAVAATMAVSSTALALNVGSWDLSDGVNNGVWRESFDGGGPGQPGNHLWANDGANDPNQWWTMDFWLDAAVENPAGSGWYSTSYLNGDIKLAVAPALWGGSGVTYIQNMTAENYSKWDPTAGTLDFTFHATGITGGQQVDLVAVFSGVLGQNYQIWQDHVNNNPDLPPGHGSRLQNSFESLTITVSNVPDAGSTLALLGPGFVGLLVLGRISFRKH